MDATARTIRKNKKNELLDWRQILYSLLLASEELEPLRQRLVAWFGDASEVEDRKWGRALAFLYAERGELEQAVGVLEKLAKELSYDEWQRVADLYLLLDRRADSERAKLRSWEQLNEWRLQSGRCLDTPLGLDHHLVAVTSVRTAASRAELSKDSLYALCDG